jgi:hypothetical protein
MESCCGPARNPAAIKAKYKIFKLKIYQLKLERQFCPDAQDATDRQREINILRKEVKALKSQLTEEELADVNMQMRFDKDDLLIAYTSIARERAEERERGSRRSWWDELDFGAGDIVQNGAASSSAAAAAAPSSSQDTGRRNPEVTPEPEVQYNDDDDDDEFYYLDDDDDDDENTGI